MEYISVSDFARQYGVSERTVRNYCATGKIEGTTDSRGYYEVQYGQTIGYQSTELTYAGDLIANAGESVTSILDKIVNMLGAYEYFYDINGAFIFQKQKIYESASINNNTLRIISPI